MRMKLKISRLRPTADSLVAKHTIKRLQTANIKESRCAHAVAKSTNKPIQKISAISSQMIKLGVSIQKLSRLVAIISMAGVLLASIALSFLFNTIEGASATPAK